MTDHQSEFPIEVLGQGIRYLASLCDGAVQRDGVGFSGPEAIMGHRLARIPESQWTAFDVHWAWGVLCNHPKQLANIGINPREIPEPADTSREDAGTSTRPASVPEPRVIEAGEDGCSFIVRFAYHMMVSEAVKAIPGRKPDTSTGSFRWIIPARPAAVQALLKVAEQYQFEIRCDPAAILAQAAAKLAPEHYIALCQGGYAVTFPKEANALRERFKAAVTGRQWNQAQAPYAWFVPDVLESVRALVKFAEAEGVFAFAEDARAQADAMIREHADEPERFINVCQGGFAIKFPRNTPGGVEGVVRAIPGRDWNQPQAPQAWFVPPTIETARAVLNLCEAYEFVADAEALAKVNDLIRESAERLIASRAEDADLVIEGLGGTPRSYQRAGAAYMLRVKRGWLADEMGTGKTCQSLMVVQAANAYRAIVVCPASLKPNWEREVKYWLPSHTVSIIRGRKATPEQYVADVVIINYDILPWHFEQLLAAGFRTIIFDEAHRLKENRTQRSSHAKVLARNCEYVLLLTGTPAPNRPRELINQLEIMRRLDEDFGGYWPFVKKFCDAHVDDAGYWDFDGASNLEELNEWLRATCFVRRLKVDVLKELPPKQRAIVPIEIKNRAEYDRAARDLKTWLREQVAGDQEFLASIAHLPQREQKRLIRARQEQKVERASRAEQLARIEALRQVAMRGKLDAVTEWTQDFLASGEKLVLFAHHREVVEGLAAHFNAPSITGDTPEGARQAAVDAFMNDPECRLIVLNLMAGGVGLTLTSASNVALIEEPWTPGDRDQAEDRVHRYGQKNAVTAWHLVASGTVEEMMYNLVDSKAQVVDAAMNGTRPTGDTLAFKSKPVTAESVQDELIALLRQ